MKFNCVWDWIPSGYLPCTSKNHYVDWDGGGSCDCLGVFQSKPNVLLISIDDLNDWVGCMGGHPQAKTPNIDRLAKMGTLFSNAHCQSPVCNSSRASMMTGRYPHTSGVYFLSPDLRQAPVLKDLKTLPEVFADHGYKTMAAGKIFHGGGNARFFQDYLSTGGFGPLPKTKISQLHGHKLWDWGIFPRDNNDEVMPDIKCANWAVKLQEEHQKPFFMGVGFYRPMFRFMSPGSGLISIHWIKSNYQWCSRAIPVT